MKYVFLTLLIFTACSSAPIRDFTVAIYEPFSDTQTIEHEDEEGNVDIIPTSDQRFNDYICMTPEDYLKERKFQEELLKSCKEWR